MKTARVAAKKLYANKSQEEIEKIKEQKEKDKKEAQCLGWFRNPMSTTMGL